MTGSDVSGRDPLMGADPDGSAMQNYSYEDSHISLHLYRFVSFLDTDKLTIIRRHFYNIMI